MNRQRKVRHGPTYLCHDNAALFLERFAELLEVFVEVLAVDAPRRVEVDKGVLRRVHQHHRIERRLRQLQRGRRPHHRLSLDDVSSEEQKNTGQEGGIKMKRLDPEKKLLG